MLTGRIGDRHAILVTGSRHWLDYASIKDRLILYPRGTIVLHGGCGKKRRTEGHAQYLRDADGNVLFKGADQIAAWIARSLNQIPWALPYFGDLGERGGPVRNNVMVDVLSTLWRKGFSCSVEAFPIGESSGTRGCLRLAESASRFLGADWPITITEGK